MNEPDFIAATKAEQREWERLDALQKAFDPGTVRRLTHLGVGAGWTCLELGPGAGSIVCWLAARVGAAGRVAALDLDTRYAAHCRAANVEIRQADVLAAELEEEHYDLIHARLVLMHIPERGRVLERLGRALKPGGWLLLEDADFSTANPSETDGPTGLALVRAFEATRALYRTLGVDATFGRRLPTVCQRLGLVEVDAEAEVPMVRGGTPRAHVGRFPAEHLTALLTSTGAASADDVTQYSRLLDDPNGWFMDFALVAAWGRRPNPSTSE